MIVLEYFQKLLFSIKLALKCVANVSDNTISSKMVPIQETKKLPVTLPPFAVGLSLEVLLEVDTLGQITLVK